MNEIKLNDRVKKAINTKKLTWEEKKIICEQWKQSGKSKAQFCKEEGISFQTFWGWCNRLWPDAKLPSRPGLTPVRVIDKLPMEPLIEVEVLISNQATLKMSLPLSSLGKLIKELYHATAIIR